MTIPELLAPAGSFESVRAACDHGADGVYIGVGPHNLRSRGANFSIDEFRDAAAYLREQKRKIYVALNSMPDDDSIDEIESTVRAFVRIERLPAAFIISDPGVMRLCRRYCPTVPLHLSTQTGVFNSASALFWKEQGIGRIILPRELSIDQVAALVKKVPIETELFIHGAMCVSVSGRCLLGAYLGKRHPNKGDCPQPCRLRYRISPQKKDGVDGEWLTVEEESGNANNDYSAYILNSKDLNTLSILPQIVSAGVSSLKIEGRNKSAHYVGAVVKVYREALDACCGDPQRYSVRKEWTEELNRLDHRPYTTGFYAGEYVLQEVGFSQSFSAMRIVGIVKAVTGEGEAVVDVKNPFGGNEILNVVPVKTGCPPFNLNGVVVTDIDGYPVERAITNRIVLVKAEEPLRVGDMLRKEDRSRSKDAGPG